MDTVPSQSLLQDIGGSLGSSQLIKSLTAKRKRPPAANQTKQPAPKRMKPPVPGNQPKSPLVPRPPTMNRQTHSASKRFKSPMVGKQLKSPVVTRSPMMRLVVSPLVIGARSPSPRLTSPTTYSSLVVDQSLSPPPPPPPPSLNEETMISHSTSHGLGSTSSPSKRRKLRSDVWKKIEAIYENGKVVKGRCTHCYEVFSATRTSGTSHMRRHLDVCEPRARMHDMVDKMKSSVVSTESSVLTDWKYDPKTTRQELVRMITLHELPFSLVEYDGFRKYSFSLNPLFEPVSRITIKEDSLGAYKNHRSALRDVFGSSNSRFSLTADLWTSNQTTGYICITCHYIDADWKVQKRIIRYCMVKTPHDGFNIYTIMLKTIRYYNIEDKLFSITLDNATVNKSMMDLLQINLLAKDMLHYGGDLFHVRCAAHVLNIIVKEGLQAIEGVIDNIRESVKYIKGSQSRKENFEEIIREVGISCQSRPSLDVATRWNSTYDMLESAFPFRDAFYELREQDQNYSFCPSPQEWEKANVVCSLLKVFKKATQVVSGSKYPTSNLYFHEIWDVREKLVEEASSANPTIQAMVEGMKTKFDKYWKISYLTNCIPLNLDPRFKFGFIDFRLKQAFGDCAGEHIAKVDKAMRNLFMGYSNEMGNTSNHCCQGNETATAVKSHPWSDWSHHINSQRNRINSELDRYFVDELFPCDDDSLDILDWWKMHSLKYPIVARMARNVLAVPASAVASESAFSTGGRVISDFRNRLSSNTIEGLICLQDWFRAAGCRVDDLNTKTRCSTLEAWMAGANN